MDSLKLKQRIVGAIVLVGLAVIFIPMILSGDREGMPLFGSNIPDQPREVEKLKSVELPARPNVPASSGEERIPVEDHTAKEIAPPDLPTDSKHSTSGEKPDSRRGKPAGEQLPAANKGDQKTVRGWAVQVGSFSNRENAMKLRNRLRKADYPAFVELMKGKQGQIYRVRVGPDPTRTLAEERMHKLRDKMKIYGVVMHHP
ncbi:MAG: SPOR domain-containing protein [Gammaproteobacteria bacterium]|nr:SPOR domain-containing protein [Gammaproteobacteria bacterium]MDH5650801.1 SPOR domain-containing protein [Gammaproteobacteria bacterium]